MPDGVGEVQDFMPPPRTGEAAQRHRMIRRVLAVRGQMRFVVDVAPRFDYARARHEVTLTPHGALFRSPELGLSLSTRCPLEIVDGRDVRARIAVRAGETATFVLDRVEPGEMPVPYSDADIAAEFDATVAFWRAGCAARATAGAWRGRLGARRRTRGRGRSAGPRRGPRGARRPRRADSSCRS
jgi:hypothetical protein